MDIGGALISAGSSLLGGLFGSKSARQQQEYAHRAQIHMARNQLQYRVEDANKAGINPYFALGATTQNYTPVTVGDPMGEAISRAGQDIGAAVSNRNTPTRNADAYTRTVQQLSIQRGQLENALLASQVAKANQPAVSAPVPSVAQRYLVDGQGQSQLPSSSPHDTTLVSDKPLERTVSDPALPHQEPGAVTDLGFGRTQSGHAPVPSSDMKQRIEDDFLSEMSWNLRNRILPMVGANYNPPYKAPEGKFWLFNPLKQEYQLYNKKDEPVSRAGRYLYDNAKRWFK